MKEEGSGDWGDGPLTLRRRRTLTHLVVNIISVIGRDVKGFLWVFHKFLGHLTCRGDRLG
jgi:hypothetical protein